MSTQVNQIGSFGWSPPTAAERDAPGGQAAFMQAMGDHYSRGRALRDDRLARSIAAYQVPGSPGYEAWMGIQNNRLPEGERDPFTGLRINNQQLFTLNALGNLWRDPVLPAPPPLRSSPPVTSVPTMANYDQAYSNALDRSGGVYPESQQDVPNRLRVSRRPSTSVRGQQSSMAGRPLSLATSLGAQ